MPIFYTALAAGLAFAVCSGRADDAVVPNGGFPASRYQTLWIQSPFTASSEDGSSDYALVGIARFDHVAYASLINKQTQEHILVTSGKPVQGLTLISVTQGHDPSGSMAVLEEDGQSLTLKLETPAAPDQAQSQPATNAAPPSAPTNTTPLPMTNAAPTPRGSLNPAGPVVPPPARIHPARVVVPLPPH